MVSNRVIDNKDFLKKLAYSRSFVKRNQLIINATTDEILTIVEICVNILRYRFPLKSRQRRRLSIYAEFLRKLSKVRSDKSARVLLQKGEGFPFAALLLPILAEVGSRLVSSLTK